MSRDKIPRAYDLAARREREFRRAGRGREDAGYRREDLDSEPVMMTFKAFLSTQDDSITDEEALQKYGEYKLEFQRQQLNEFFVSNKDKEWFRTKYHPALREARDKEVKDGLARRLEVFTSLVTDQVMAGLAVDETNQEKLVQLMDKVVVLLEGGTEEDYEEILSKEGSEDCPKQLHRTNSIFLSSLHPSITRAQLTSLASRYPGFLRLALSEPDSNNKFVRKCWLTFERGSKVREICFGLNSQKIGDHEIKPVVNKDLSRRVRVVDRVACDPDILQLSLTQCEQLVARLDTRAGLHTITTNPVLQGGEGETAARLDRLILYLRIVHSLDFYNQTEYPLEDEMPNRCGLLHVRPAGEEEAGEKEQAEFARRLEERLGGTGQPPQQITEDRLAKLGLRREEDEMEKFMKGNMQELETDKWLCSLSGKKFKAPEFVRKHIINKYGEKVDEVKVDAAFFNNYIRDDNRPRLPVPATPVKRAREEVAVLPAARPSTRDSSPPGKRRGSVRDRLGVGGVKVSYSATDPRDIVDYSDVETFGGIDFDY